MRDFMYGLTDTHCHITDERLFSRIDEIMENAKAAGVVRMLVVCVGFEEYERAEQLREKGYPLDIAVGFHPCDLYKFNEADYRHLEELAACKKLIAIGEIGLDYHWDDVAVEDQKIGFIRQLKLAEKYHLPVLIHMREATKDTVEILLQHSCVGVMHCYSGSYETAEILIRHGYYISYGGPLTFKNSRGAPQVAAKLPIERLLIETDCPYLTPHPFRGKENEPKYISYTFEKLCEIRDMEKEVLAEQLEQNYRRLFYQEG